MTSAPALHLGGGAAVRPVARLSAANLRANALLAGSAVGGDVLAADAWGHGAEWVASTLSALGIAPDGLRPEVLFGLPGSGTRPVMSLRGRVLGCKPLLTGEGVSYGYTHRAPADTVVALVTGGYAQGVVRSLGNAVSVGIAGRRHRIVGRVAMDVCVVDVGSPVPWGSEVVYFGDAAEVDPMLGEWMDATGLGAGEIVATVGARARREVVG